jgi:hypothetical protein
MIINDGKNKIFKLTENDDGKCKVEILDRFYFGLFCLQGDRINKVNRELINTDFSDKSAIEKLILADNDTSWTWEVSHE